MKALSIAGSLRRDSSNKKFAREAARLLIEHALANAEFIDLSDYPMPLYNGDREKDEGVPAEAAKLGARIAEAGALIVATPEYNGGISSVLKNTVDWISRLQPMPVSGKHVLLLSASQGGWGGVRGLWHSRVPLEALGVHVFPQMMALPNAGTAFDEVGRLRGGNLEQLRNLLFAFVRHAGSRGERPAASANAAILPALTEDVR